MCLGLYECVGERECASVREGERERKERERDLACMCLYEYVGVCKSV